MLGEYEDKRGASANLDDRLKGELLATFAELKSRYGTTRLELAWSAITALLNHVEKHEGLAEMVEFSERAADVLGDNAKEIRTILDDDHRKRAH